MKRLKKAVSIVLLLCLITGCVAAAKPEKAWAALDAGDGTVTVSNLDNEFVKGKFRFWQQIVYKKKYKSSYDYYGLTLKNEYVANAAGKKVATWKPTDILEGGGSKKESYTVDFTRLPSGKYTLYISIKAEYNGKESTWWRSIDHKAGTIKYNSAKIVTNTDGSKDLKVNFQFIMLKGYSPKLDIYNSAGKKVKSYSNCVNVNTNDNGYTFTWRVRNDSGEKVSEGTYTFKVTCNGKTCSQKVTIKNF